jgi:prenyltransferase beta subunit
VTTRDRVLVAVLLLGALLAAVAVVATASQLCPGPTPNDPCPDADRNRILVLALAATAVFGLMAGLAFVADYATHQRIVYRGAWGRATRRGILAGLVLAAVAGLRLVDALNVFSALVVIVVAGAAEWLATRRLDAP